MNINVNAKKSLFNLTMSSEMHSEPRLHAFGGEGDGGEAAGGQRVLLAQPVQDVVHVVVELLELARVLDLVGGLDVLNHSVVALGSLRIIIKHEK